MIQKEIIRGSRILIVDDEPANVLLLERILQQGGYTNLSKTNDPRQVLEFFKVYQPDLILLDLMMPNVDGYSLLTQLRSRVRDDLSLLGKAPSSTCFPFARATPSSPPAGSCGATT